MSSITERFPEGSCWLHFWVVGRPGNPELALAIQWEQVGIAISAAPYVLIRPTQAALLLDTLATLPDAVRDEDGVSLRLGE